ncbi:MAG: hypothetical protein HC875_37270 [Anaerolineales bacterium]|nr:hypothetical protein [Anaerolineales bacterium]
MRARWYDVGTGTFLSRDVVESEPAYQYVRGNPVNRIDPSGLTPSFISACQNPKECEVAVYNGRLFDWWKPIAPSHTFLIYTDENGQMHKFEAHPHNWSTVGITPPKGIPTFLIPKTLIGDPPEKMSQADLQSMIDKDPQTGKVTAKGKELCDKLLCLLQVNMQINFARPIYHDQLLNSNSYVYTLLNRCKLPIISPTGWNVAWGTDVLLYGPTIEETYRRLWDSLELYDPLITPPGF